VIAKDIGISMHYLRNRQPILVSASSWIIKCFLAEMRTGIEIVRSNREFDLVIFYMAYPYHLLPLIATRLMRKKSIEILTRSRPKTLLMRMLSIQDQIFFALVDGISPETESISQEHNLRKWKHKILPKGARFIDIEQFKKSIDIERRNKVIGYVGRIEKEKGIEEMVKAIPLISKEIDDIKFVFVGSGSMLQWLRNECKRIQEECHIGIDVIGFVDGSILPEYYNRFRYLLLPTLYAEGLPTVILEAMSCGTPVIAPNVGGIRDVVKNDKTGFILESPHHETIAETIIKEIDSKNLAEMSNNARTLIENQYSIDLVVSRYQEMLRRTLQ
jgi:glycosyltransferase involved in cell wall biosynthesis